MKNFLLVGLVAVFAFACGRVEDAVTPAETCTDSGSGSCQFTTCSNGISTYYTWNGKRYSCSGTDCTAAAQDLAEEQVAAGC